LPTVAEANPLQTLRQIFQLKARYGRMPGLGTGLKAWARRKTGETRIKSPPYPYPPWLNKDLEKRFGMLERWDAFWASYMTGPKGHPRHPLLYESLMSPGWNTDDLEMNGDLTTPEERDPYLDLRLVEFVLSLPPMPWLYEKHILRQSMRSALPNAVIERPKQLLGALASSLFEQARIDDCLSGDALIDYVDAAALRKATAGSGKSDLDYVNLRPLILGQWLQIL
jgi:asparagine synthase (glutamine-hydrolysing)